MRFGENNKNTVSFLSIKIEKINSGNCHPNKEKRVLTRFCRLVVHICAGCRLPRWLNQDNRCVEGKGNIPKYPAHLFMHGTANLKKLLEC